MEKIIGLATKLSKIDGVNSTNLDDVYIYKASEKQARAPFLYDQGVIFILQGSKKIYTENQVYEYNKDNFLVVTVPLPLECEGFLSEDGPLLAVALNINISMLNGIIHSMEESVNFNHFDTCTKKCGLFTSKVTGSFEDILLRLLTTLQDPIASKVIGVGIVKELLFEIMKGDKAAPLYALAMKNTNLSKIEMALKEIHGNYDRPIDVNGLASIVNMSVSSFHHTFKDVTSSSPIQYLKKLRLDKAKRHITEEGLRVNEAARMVGYESVSQFSREFKRYYGSSPKEFAS